MPVLFVLRWSWLGVILGAINFGSPKQALLELWESQNHGCKPLHQCQVCSAAQTAQGGLEKTGRLTIQCDEMWSFVSNKDNKQWIGLALDVSTREIVGVYLGNRT